MRVAMHQPYYLPWICFFDKIDYADLYLCSEDSPFSRNNFHNRVKIRTSTGNKWLTVPMTKGDGMPMNEAKINYSTDWQHQHLSAFKFNYSRADNFDVHWPFLKEFYSYKWESLAEMNVFAIHYMLKVLKIETPMISTVRLSENSESPTHWILNILKYVGADVYVSGANGRNYLNEQLFNDHGIELEYFENCPEDEDYTQLWEEIATDYDVTAFDDILINYKAQR